MKRVIAASAFASLLAGCSTSSMPGSATPSSQVAAAPETSPFAKTQTVYWTIPGAQGNPEVQFTRVPLRANSNVTTIDGNSKNKLSGSLGMHIDAAGRAWILTSGPNGQPGIVYVFDLPLTQQSAPRYTFVLSGTAQPQQLAFDASGNMWVTNNLYSNSVFEFTGPFTHSGTLSPALTLTDGIRGPSGLAFDKAGSLYVANSASDVKHSIAIFAVPISNKQPYFLNGLVRPGGLIFDAAGNLYASDNYTSLSAIVRYNGDHLKAGARPDIVNRKGLNETFEANFAFTSSGDLYFSNCGTHPSVYRYATSRNPFTEKLAPSIDYTDGATIECAWGLAIN